MIHEILKILDTTELQELEKQRITTDLLRLFNVVERSEQYFCCKDQIEQRCNEQCLGCFQFENNDYRTN